MNILILTREANKDANSIYNSYTQGIVNNYPDTKVIDYFDLYFESGKEGFESTISQTIKQNQIELIFINFVSGDLTFDINFLEKLSSQCFIMMNFYDTELFFEPIDRYYAQCADLVILPSSSDQTYGYKLLGINAISTLSLFDTSQYIAYQLKQDIDVSFVGDITKQSRQEYIDYLLDNGIKVEVYGKGTHNGHLSFEDMHKIFSRSKINLNFSDTVEEREFNAKANINYTIVPKIVSYSTQLKGRSIEISLCKGFTLSQYANGIDELFQEDEIAIFHTKEELLKKINHYLISEIQRQEMTNKAHKSSLKRFDATKVFHSLFKNLNITEARKKKTIYLDNSFEKNFNSYHTLYLFNFLFKFRLILFSKHFKYINFTKVNTLTSLNYLKQQFHYQVLNKLFKRS